MTSTIWDPSFNAKDIELRGWLQEDLEFQIAELEALGMGYLGIYEAGLQFTSSMQFMSHNYLLLAPRPDLVLPYVTDGSGEAELALFQTVGGGGSSATTDGIENVVALRLFVGTKHGQLVRTLGHTNAGQGSTVYYWDSLNVTADNNGTIIAVTGISVGRWVALTNGKTDVSQFGALHGGDCYAAALALAAWCKSSGDTFTGAGDYTMSNGPVDLRTVAVEAENMRIITTSAAAQIILGNTAVASYGPSQSLGQLWKSNSVVTTDPTIKIIGSKGQIITLGFTNKFQVYADDTIAADSSTAYSTFNIGRTYRIEFATNMAQPDGTIQWINENTFNVKRCDQLDIGGTYHHNHNKFNTGTFEGTATINMGKGASNLLICERFENGPVNINFGDGTWGNFVMNSWHGNTRSAYDPTSVQYNITDLGRGNMVIRNSDYAMRQNEVMSLNSRTCRSFSRVTENQTTLVGGYASAAGQHDFEITVNFQIVLDTGLIPVRLNDGFQAIMDGTKFRARWLIYDASGAELTAVADSSLLLRDGATTTLSGNSYTQSVGVAESVVIVTGATVGFVKCQIYGNGATGTGQRFRHVGVRSLTQHQFKDGDQRVNCMASRTAAAVAKPVIGFARLGESVNSTTLTTVWRCTFSETTFLAAGMAGGATTFTVVATGTKAIGDVVGIQLDTGATHWTTLSAVAPLTLTVALPSAAAIGKPVCFNRWI